MDLFGLLIHLGCIYAYCAMRVIFVYLSNTAGVVDRRVGGLVYAEKLVNGKEETELPT